MFLIISFLTIPLTFLTFPKRAEAVCTPFTVPPVPDPLSVPIHQSKTDTWNIADSIEKSNTWFKTCVLDGLATMIAKTIIKQLTGSIVRWINSGFKGNPSFVQNPGRFFGGIADKVGGNVIENIAPFLCSPFRLNLQLAMAMAISGQGSQQEIGCTLTDVQNNINGVGGGMSGWNSWFQVTQNAQNNPYGAAMLASAQLNFGIETAQGKYQQQLDWGRGFLSFEECPSSDTSGSNPYGLEPDTSNPNQAVKQIYDANTQPVYGVQAGNNGCVTKTPGAVIESQLNNVLGSDLRGLEIAQSIDQIVAALVGQLVSQALGGLGGLASAGSSNSSGSSGNNNFNYQNSINSVGGVGTTNTLIPNLPITGACTPNKQTAKVGESVTWNAYVPDINGNVTYTWYGDENLTSNSSSVTTSYATSGPKMASVLVTTTGPNPQSQMIDCTPNIQIGNTNSTTSSTITISCIAAPNMVSINTPVTWQVVVLGGVPPFIYSWQGDDGLAGTGQSTIKSYPTTGLKTAIVSVTSADGNTYSNVCSSTVNVTP